jgi:hypothetical protein
VTDNPAVTSAVGHPGGFAVMELSSMQGHGPGHKAGLGDGGQGMVKGNHTHTHTHTDLND